MSTFLTTDELKSFTAISANVDVSLLANFIPIAEQMYVEKVLGLALTTDIKTTIDSGSLPANYQSLLDEYVLPTCAWYSFYEASPFLLMRAEAKGIVKKSGDNSTSVDQKEFSIYRQSILDKASFYKNRLIDYLEDNKSLFPLYRSENEPRPNKTNSSGIFLG